MSGKCVKEVFTVEFVVVTVELMLNVLSNVFVLQIFYL